MARQSLVKKQATYTARAANAAAKTHQFIYVSGTPGPTLKKRKMSGAVRIWDKEGLDVVYDTVFRITGKPVDVAAALSEFYTDDFIAENRRKAKLPPGGIDGYNVNTDQNARAIFDEEIRLTNNQPKKGKAISRGDPSKKLSGSAALNYLMGLAIRIKFGGKIEYTASSDPPMKRKGVTRTLKEKYDSIFKEYPHEEKWLNVSKWTRGPAATGSRIEGPPSEKSTVTFWDPSKKIRIKSTSLPKYVDALRVLGLEMDADLAAAYKAAQSNAAANTGVKGKGVVHNPPPAAELVRDKEKAKSPTSARSGRVGRAASPLTPSALLRSASPSGQAPSISGRGASLQGGSVPLVAQPSPNRTGSVGASRANAFTNIPGRT